MRSLHMEYYPPPDPESHQPKRRQLNNAPGAKEWCVRSYACVCIACADVDVISKRKESFKKSTEKVIAFGWVCVEVFLITVLTLSRPSSRTIGKDIKSPPFLRLPDIANQLTVGTKYGAHSIFTGDRDRIVLITHPSRTCVASLK